MDAAGISRNYLTRLVRRGQLQKLGRGIYAAETLPASEHLSLLEVSRRVPKAVICLLSALKFHEIGTQVPREIWIAIDVKAWAPNLYGSLTNQSSEGAKIRLFRFLFCGREYVYARRFESQKTGKSGYQPACSNEWRVGVCLKPQVSCSRCERRQFIPLTDGVIQNHVMGKDPSDRQGRDFTIGV